MDEQASGPSRNVELVRDALEHFLATGEFAEQFAAEDFVWDMSTFRDWPEQQTYEGSDGARSFLRDWVDAWEDWELEVESLHDAGEKVVAVMRQRGRSKTSGMSVEMSFAHVFSLRDGLQTRMQMYSDPAEAFAAVGLQR
jgi:ketosteroid isomerase-like protein